MDSNRRDFLKNACSMCGALVGIGIVLPSLSSCSTLASVQTNIKSGTVAVPKETFTTENKVVLIKNAAAEFDIAVIQFNTDGYSAFYMECTHESTGLVPTRNGFFCNAHGSSFTLEGKVKTPPATRDLKALPVVVESTEVIVTI